MRVRWMGTVVLLGAVLVAAGCPYSTRSSLPEHIQTVEVPVFGNSTFYKGLETQLTAGLIDAFQNDPQLRVVDQGANAVLSGEIIDVQRTVYRETRQDQPASVSVSVVVRASLYDNVERRFVFKDLVFSSSDSSSTAGLYQVDRGERQSEAERGAIEVLSKEIVRRISGGW